MNNLTDSILHDPQLAVAFLVFLVSLTAIAISLISLYWQRTHNRKSVKPIGIITLSDYEDLLGIKIQNAGVGPLIFKSITTVNEEGKSKDYPIDWMPSGIIWSDVRRELENHSIVPGDIAVLLEYEVDLNDSKSKKTRDTIRSILKDLRGIVKYTDVYEKKIFSADRSLDWFGRNL